MSTASSPRSPTSPAHATRQLLDELDALMQRMLALPVNQVEEELRTRAEEPPPSAPELVSFPEPEGRAAESVDLVHNQETSFRGTDFQSVPPPADGLEIRPTREDEPPPAPELPHDVLPAPVLRTLTTIRIPEEDSHGGPARVESETWESELPASPEVLEALGRPPRKVPEEAAPPGPTVRPTARPLPPAAVAPPPPGWLQPLVWANRLFDFGTACLGPPGRWLRGPSGRSLLGWVGLGLLAGALGWLLCTEIGWSW